MKWLDALRARVRLLLRRGAAESRMDEEFRFHVDMETEANIRAGMPPAEARRRALVSFGGVERQKERMRDERGGRGVADAYRDARYAVRTLRRAPGFSAVSILTLGLGIGAVTAMFGLVNAILIRPLPYPDSERLVSIRHAAPGLGLSDAGLSSGTYFHYAAHAGSLESLALYTEAVVNLSGGGAVAERVELAMVDPGFFDVLGVKPSLGRFFNAEEIAVQDGLDHTVPIPVVISHELWRRRYGADPEILGRTIDINTRGREVVGVLPPGFAFPRPGTQVWMLTVTPAATANFARSLTYDAVARLRPGVTPSEAETELARVLPGIEGRYPDATAERLEEVRLRPIVTPLKAEVVGRASAALWVLLGSMGLLLLAACANVTNLVLVRAQHRMRELSVRVALGARRADLVRLFVGESALLSFAAAGVGLALAAWALAALVAFAPVDLPRLDEVGLDWPVFGFALGLAMLVTLLVGITSILRHSRPVVVTPALRSGGRGATAGPEGRRVRAVFVAAQVALALTLLAGSALMVQSFVRLVAVDPGFDPDGVLVVDMGLPFSRAMQHRQIYDALLERVRAIPGVAGAAAASDLPLTESVWTASIAFPLRVAGRAPEPGEVERPVALKFFMPGFFQVMGTPIVDGIGFAPGERTDAPHPVVISAALADRLFPGERAVGRRVRRIESTGEEVRYRDASGEWTRQPDYVVVGVAGDVRDASLRDGPAEIVYVPVLEPRVDPGFIPTELSLVIRSEGPPMMLAPAVRDIIREIDPVLGVARIRTLDDIVAAATARERFLALLLVVAGVSALFLGALGIYGVVGYTVRQRTPEIGIRVALGASREEITRMVLRDSITMVAVGAVAGLATATAAARVLRSFLFDMSPGDPLTLISVTGLLLMVAFVATVIPARRAARAEPMAALRAE